MNFGEAAIFANCINEIIQSFQFCLQGKKSSKLQKPNFFSKGYFGSLYVLLSTNKGILVNFHLPHWLHKSDFFSPSAMCNLWTFVRPARFTLVNWLLWSCVLVVGKGLLGGRMEGGNRLIQGRRSCSIGGRGRGILWWIPKLFVFLWAWIRCVVWLIWPCIC